MMLEADLSTGRMWSSKRATLFADRPYLYSLSGRCGEKDRVTAQLARREVFADGGETLVTGLFSELNVALRQRIRVLPGGIEETISLQNRNTEPVTLADIGMGFAAGMAQRQAWRLCAIPFRVQLDGSRHDHSVAELQAGHFENAVYRDPSRPFVPLDVVEEGRLRSEAWAWWHDDQGLVVIKYNNADVEMSVAAPLRAGTEHVLRFGGVGTSLYGEPCAGHLLPPGGEYEFGKTYYFHVEGPLENAFRRYRDFLDDRHHSFPDNYNPPVTWNELYDIGWHHSDPEQLGRHYTRERLLQEAAKARACGCEMLYLDPGWEVAEGATLWNESRLGTVADLADVLRREYGLQLGLRTILRCYRDVWPQTHLVLHAGHPKEPMKWSGQLLWDLCLCDRSFFKQKLERLLAIVRQGVRFLMVDEMDWRGPCSDPAHGHTLPTTVADHARAVYALCRDLRRQCPELTIECHDPVWPWHTSIYAPTYYRQGFGDFGDYEENWGFEYMWDCVNDLRTGKALALYYYNLACNIPLYLHITMAADNDACLFFWWAASTVRHLGIGGKHGHATVNPKGLHLPEPEKRFAAYQKQMLLYRKLKDYFVRGTFHGLAEHVHLHTLPKKEGGVLAMFNLTDTTQAISTEVTFEQLQSGRVLRVNGATAEFGKDGLRIIAEIPSMSPAIVTIGEAVEAV